jgi:predicted dehydrogenase/threonine dehydrogenase-like Zn-dependent dehydrogenase
MKQVIRKGLKHIIVDEVPDPVAKPHHVLIRPVYSLISSGTETASIHQESVLKEVAEKPSHLATVWNALKSAGPVATFREVKAKFSEYGVLGYSGAGLVVEKHPTVGDIEIGDRVAYGGEGTGHGETIITGRNLVARVPGEVSFEHASFATLGSIAMNAVRTAQIGLGDQVVVIGLGLVGQLVTQLVRLQGGVVTGIDLRPERLSLAKKLGAHSVVTGGAGAREAVLGITGGRGADCVIVAAAAKSAAPAKQALESCRDRGRIVIVGAVALEFPWNDMYLKEIQLYMARAYGPGSYDPVYEKRGQDYPLPYVRWTENRNMEEFLRLVGEGSVRLEPLITHRFPLERAPEAYQKILDPASGTLAVLLEYEPVEPAQFLPKRKVEVVSSSGSAGKRELGAGLAGAGNLARWAHLPNLKKMPEVGLKAIYSASGVRGKSFAVRFGAGYACSDYDQMLRDQEIDFIVIVSRNQDHARQAEAALRAGKHVFVEKPMALTEDECRQLYAAVQETGKRLTVGFNRRFAPDYVDLKRQVARRSGPAVINCRVNSPGISGSFWMADPAIGGAILGEACHFVDLMYWLLEAEPVSVSAYSLPTDRKEPVGQNNLAASFRFADGSIANLTYCTVGSRTSGGERVEVFTEGNGAFTADFKELTVAGSGRRRRSRWFAAKGYGEQMRDFVRGIREGAAPAVTVVDGARATFGCLAMLESARRMEPVTIDLTSVTRQIGQAVPEPQ